MLSFARTATRANPSLVFVAQLLFVLLCLLRPIHGGSLRAHRLRGSESDSPQAPNADMLKALEYIQSLRQRTDSQEEAHLPAEDGLDDSQKMRSMLRLNEDEGKDEDEESEDKSEELLQAVLSALQQTEKASKPALLHPSSLGGGQVKQQRIMPHKKMPLMFEDEEEGEGDEEEDEHKSPFKRTNENVEEKYTPQNLATLQSIFDELDKFTTEKIAHKRQDDEDDEEDMFNLRNVDYDDKGVDFADWGPMEDQDEKEEEENKHELDRSLDYVDDEEEDESYPVKRSNDPDEVDYYLFKVLEKTEAEEQKRAIEEEEEERAERGVAQYNIDPQVIYQLIHSPQKYKIPPLDLLDLLKTKPQSNNKLWQMSSRKLHRIPQAQFYRRPSFRQSSPKNLQREEILNILGLGNNRNRGQAPVRKPYSSWPSQHHTLTTGRGGDAASTLRRFSSGKSSEYDGAAADQLAAYLAAQMLARYPGPANRYSQKREEGGQSATGSFEQAMQDYLDQMDSGKEPNDKRQTEGGEDNPVMKLMSYLNLESEDSENGTKTGKGM